MAVRHGRCAHPKRGGPRRAPLPRMAAPRPGTAQTAGSPLASPAPRLLPPAPRWLPRRTPPQWAVHATSHPHHLLHLRRRCCLRHHHRRGGRARVDRHLVPARHDQHHALHCCRHRARLCRRRHRHRRRHRPCHARLHYARLHYARLHLSRPCRARHFRWHCHYWRLPCWGWGQQMSVAIEIKHHGTRESSACNLVHMVGSKIESTARLRLLAPSNSVTNLELVGLEVERREGLGERREEGGRLHFCIIRK